MEENEGIMPFERDKKQSIIKVIGVGGGGGNAVNHMYREGIHDVTFVVCNTDKQALDRSPIPDKLQLGEGLGAGNNPEKGRAKALEGLEDIKRMLSDGCRMVFITAGMGGGTGTGAAPIIAKTAKEMGILTVGIVTIPFLFEGNKKIDQALDGVEEMSKNVDALLVVNNQRLYDVYSDLSVMNAFAKADDTLSVAAKGISEIITYWGTVNLDFEDVTMALKDGGVALMSTGYGEGEGRVTQAIDDALHSPLLNNNDIFHSKKVLFKISTSKEKNLMMDELREVDEFMSRFNKDLVTKYGVYEEEGLGEKVKFTILASGFGMQDIPGMAEVINKRTEEEIEKKQQEEAAEREKEERRNRYYNQKIIREVNSYVFTQDELDNEDIISMVETTPTYKRTKTDLNKIKQKAQVEAEAPQEPEETDAPSNRINF